MHVPTSSQPKWGRPMNKYLPSYSGNHFLPLDDIVHSYSLDYIKTIAIPRINRGIKPFEDVCDTYKAILSLLRFPSELQALRNTNLLSRCLGDLRDYISSAKKSGYPNVTLFSHEAGFLCFRVIVLLLQVGILVHTDSLSRFSGGIFGASDPYKIATSLSEYTIGLLHLSRNKPSPRDWLLDPSSSQRVGGRMFLKSIGGFDDIDAEDLLKLIWKDRNHFLEISSCTPTPGWALLLLILGEHMRWKSEVEYTWPEGWFPLETLCLRYSLVASTNELKALEALCLDVVQDRPDPEEEGDDAYYEGSLVDVRDAKVFIQAHNQRMERLSKDPFPEGLATLLLRFITQRNMLCAVDLMPPSIGTACSRIWSKIDSAKRSSAHLSEDVGLIKYTTELLDLIEKIYRFYAGEPAALAPIAQILANNDFVNLFGRIILIPLSWGSPIGMLAKGNFQTFVEMDDLKDPHGVARSWFDLTFEALQVVQACGEARGSLNKIFDPFYSDWMKMRRCFDANFPQHPISSKSFEQHIKGCRVALTNFAHSFGYSERASRVRLVCIYSRCAGASMEGDVQQLVCSRCMAASYCSTICQSKDWADEERHRKSCNHIVS